MRILLFAQLKDAAGCAQLELNCGEVDADGFWRQLLAAQPGLAPFRSSVRLAKNSGYVGGDVRFTDADEVALIPPVSGG